MFTRIVTVAFLMTLVVSLGACASSPAYVAADDAGDYGYYSDRIAGNRHRVNFNGNRHTSFQDTRNYALLRAAELTLAEGYDWFEIVDRESLTTEAAHRTEPGAGVAFEQRWYVRDECGLLTCTRRVYPASYSSTRFEFDASRPVTRHSYSIEIVLGKGDEPDDGRAYDARDVMRTIYAEA